MVPQTCQRTDISERACDMKREFSLFELIDFTNSSYGKYGNIGYSSLFPKSCREVEIAELFLQRSNSEGHLGDESSEDLYECDGSADRFSLTSLDKSNCPMIILNVKNPREMLRFLTVQVFSKHNF